jgi:uncharacterized protein (TIGR03790 family)
MEQRTGPHRRVIGRMRIVWLAVPLFFGLPAALHASERADRVIILANSSVPDSVAVARHYARVRGVPLANLIALPMPTSETITWKQFVPSIWEPLEAELVKRGWIDAIRMDLVDAIGRHKYAVSGHRIAALVTCWGVPLRIENDPSLYTEFKPYTDHPEFRTNQGAVDSELSLLASPEYPINAGLPNPLFHNPEPTDGQRQLVVEVSRLDGPTPADAMALVDKAVQAERDGLLGRAYVDLAGPAEKGNQWLDATAQQIMALGFDVSVGRGPSTVPETARFDAPVLYFGWYAADINGPFLLPGFRFPPGAIAVHMHSFSAHTLRSKTEGWCGPLISRGATATLGNVYEPYLEFMHRPDYFFEALSHGADLVDAAYYALPTLSWQSIVIGDPLYRPFVVPLSAQLSDLSKLPPQFASYAVIRKMNQLDVDNQKDESIEMGKAEMKEVPSLALALALADRLAAAGLVSQSVWVLKDAVESASTASSNWELIREAAQFLSARGRSAEAIDMFQKLFEIDQIPKASRLQWLAEAHAVALDAGDSNQASQWKEEYRALGGKPLDPKR